MRIPRICLAVSFSLLLPSLAVAQGVATGDLHISVKDPQGNAVITATVVARDQEKGAERSATGDGLGDYSIVSLPPASYTVTVSAQGFSPVTVKDVVINVGGSANLPVSLGIEGAKETITVNSEAALIETSEVVMTSEVFFLDIRLPPGRDEQ